MNFIETVKSLSGPTLALITTRTEVKMNKKDVATKTEANPYLGATKLSTLLVELAPKYEKTVNDQREAEGKAADFEVSERAWGTNVGNGIVENKGKFYISYILKESKSKSKEFFFNDEEIEFSLLESFIPKKKPDVNPVTEKAITFSSVSVENIVSMELV